MTTPKTTTVPEAGKLLGISRKSAYQAASRGELPTIRIGRRIVVPVDQLQALLAGTWKPERDGEVPA